MDTVLITGGTGFLGSKIVELFLSNNFRVVILVRKGSSYGRIEKLLDHPYLSKVFFDKDNMDECFNKFKIDSIIHVATCYGRNNESWLEIADVNFFLPLKLLLLAEQFSIKSFINADTFFNEDMVFSGNESNYVKTKKDFLRTAEFLLQRLKIKFFNLKIEQMYGIDDSSKKFISFITKELLSNNQSISLTKGGQRRDFIFVDDVAQAFLNVFENQKHLGSYEEFGIGTGQSVSIKEAVDYLKDISGSKSILEFGKLDYRKNEIMDSKANLNNNKKINWVYTVGWQKGFKETINFFIK